MSPTWKKGHCGCHIYVIWNENDDKESSDDDKRWKLLVEDKIMSENRQREPGRKTAAMTITGTP